MTPLADPRLPGLRVALDVDLVLDELRRVLPECRERLELTSGRILDVRYQPRSHCWLVYRIETQDRATRRPHRALLSAEVLAADETPRPPPPDLVGRYEALRDGPIRTATSYLPSARMTVASFPIDPLLPSLFEACDPLAMKRALDRLAPGREPRVRQVSPHVLRYIPGRRATFRYDVVSEQVEEAAAWPRQLIGKVRPSQQSDRSFANLVALSRVADGRLPLARPVGYLAPFGLSLQEFTPGHDLASLAASASLTSHVRQAAEALATLHGLTLPLTPRAPRHEARVVHAAVSLLAMICPDRAERLAALRDQLAAEIEACTAVSGPVHGDFDLNNLLVDGDQVTLVDFDLLALGDPLLDVSRLLASLRRSAFHLSGRVDGLAEAADGFLADYRRLAAAPERKLRLFEAAALLAVAATAFRGQRPGWEAEVGQLVDEADRVRRAARVVPVALTEPRPSSTPDDRRRWVADETYMQAVLAPHVQSLYGAELSRCRVTAIDGRSKRERFQYELAGCRQGRVWTRSLVGLARPGRRRRTLPRRLAALRQALDGQTEAPVLPSPVAYVPQLSLLILDPPHNGRRLRSLAGTSRFGDALARLAAALAAVHHASVGLDRSRSLDADPLALWRAVDRLSAGQPDLHPRALDLSAEVDRRCRRAASPLVPTLRRLELDWILDLGDRVAFTDVHEVLLAHPLTDVAHVLERLTLLEMERGPAMDGAALAQPFRHRYAEETGTPREQMAAFEVAALLHRGCARAARDSELAERLLDRAEARLATP